MDLALLLSLYAAHKWLLIAALVIGFSVRQIKPDAAFPVDIAPRYRPLVALAIGGVATASDMLLRGDSLKQAAFIGLGGAAIAILGHVFGVEVVLGGKELPPLGRKGPKPPSKPGDGMMGGALRGLAICIVAAIAAILSACKLTPQQIDSGVDVGKAGCELISAVTGDATVKTVCATLDEREDIVKSVLSGIFGRADGGMASLPSTNCATVTGKTTTVCAPPAELGKAIDEVVAKRAARLLRDAGGR